MSAPAHHLDPATVLAYAAGALPTAFAIVAAIHLEVCGPCRTALRAAEGVGAHLLGQLGGAPLTAGARSALRQRLVDEPIRGPDARAQALASRGPDMLPPPLQPFFGARYSRLRWSWLAPGIRYLDARPDSQARLLLLQVAIGHAVPAHRHGGHELTMVLRGAYEDVLGRFGPGDVADLDSGTEHRPLAVSRQCCIWAAALDAPLQWQDAAGPEMARHLPH